MKLRPVLLVTSFGLFVFLLLCVASWTLLSGNERLNESLVETAMLPSEECDQILQRLPMVSMSKPRILKRWSTPEQIFQPTFSPNGRHLLLGGEGGSQGIGLYETQSWKEIQRIPAMHGYATFSPDSRLIATDERGVSLYRAKDALLLHSFKDGTGNIEPYGVWGPVTFSPDGNRIAMFGEDPQAIPSNDNGPSTESANVRLVVAKVWNIKTGKLLKMVHKIWSGGHYAVTFLPEKSLNGGEVRVFGNYEIAQKSVDLLALRQGSENLDDFEIVTLHGGKEIGKGLGRPWPWSPGEGTGIYKPRGVVKKIPRPQQCRIYISADASILIGSSVETDEFRVWPVRDGKLLQAWTVVETAKFWAWRVRDGKLLRAWTLPGGRADAVAISPDTRTCVISQPINPYKPTLQEVLPGRSLITVFDLGLKSSP